MTEERKAEDPAVEPTRANLMPRMTKVSEAMRRRVAVGLIRENSVAKARPLAEVILGAGGRATKRIRQAMIAARCASIELVRSRETTRLVDGSLTARARATRPATAENAAIKQLYAGLGFRKLALFTALWALAIIPQRFGSTWDDLSFASGLGAILATAVLTNDALKLLPRSSRLADPSAAVENAQTSADAWSGRRTGALQDIEEFFEPQFRFGGPRERNLKLSTFVLRERDWMMLQQALYDTFLKGAPPLLFEMGHQVGTSIARDLRKVSPKVEVVLSYFEELSRRAGWGIISLDGDIAGGSRITFRIQESPFCVCANPHAGKDMDSCHFVNGLASGILEEVYGWPYATLERKCVVDGGSCCEVVATQRTDARKLKERWNLSVMFPTRHPWLRV